MSWFTEQIKQRNKNDQHMLEDSFSEIANAVLGRRLSSVSQDELIRAGSAIQEIMAYYNIPQQELPSHLKTTGEVLDYMVRPSGIMYRDVSLTEGWYRNGFGAMLGKRTDGGGAVALIPNGVNGYKFFDRKSQKMVKVNAGNADLIDREAIVFYKPFPQEKLSLGDLLRFNLEILSGGDIIRFAVSALIIALIGLTIPALTYNLIQTVAVSQNYMALIASFTFFICAILSQTLIRVARTTLQSRIQEKIVISMSAAGMMRMMNFPADFFSRYSTGELSKVQLYIQELGIVMTQFTLEAGLTAVFSLIYIIQIFHYTPMLAVPAFLVVLVIAAISFATFTVQRKVSIQQMRLAAKESGVSYALITGIQKIHLAGAEKRAFARWGRTYARSAEKLYNIPMILKVHEALVDVAVLAGGIVFYCLAISGGVSPAEYFAFNSAYGLLSVAFVTAAQMAPVAGQMASMFENIRSVLETEPETSPNKHVVDRLSGKIEINNLRFKYPDATTEIFRDLSLSIKPGEYVAIVGRSGCGKSTLLRLLLGFEEPTSGGIFYDDRDISTIDLKSLRKNMSVVLQNGKLLQGSILQNIRITAPDMSEEEVWKAAEIAGIAEDIERMPMGMNTMIADGAGNISGGQKQRILIARAIAPKPKILMMDEATSALDNITQKQVSQALDKMDCTRIIIAHRLSTIQNCSRIVMLDEGRIVEEGTYDELIARGGCFTELVKRQMIN